MGSAVAAPAANFQVALMRTCPLCRRRPSDDQRFPSRCDMTDCSDVSFQPLSARREFELTTAESDNKKTARQQQVTYAPAVFV